ncbi:MAG: tRNA (N6-threonylcarbamoyladenosine(37)-N6)-methyltransferase TrmO [Elusimicrobiota bacterium]|nr:MAG: tRNA (N6-threonylcarbamoyladenosine(37)-N6)-methyltransferase TrmO [Elusimicrobiota bacterium]
MADSPLRVIGHLRSCFREKFGTPRQPLLVPGATASLTIAREHLPEHSLDGLGLFSHVWLLSYFHLNTNKMVRPKIHPPRLKGKSVGLFASRSPHRPSPIGLSLAKLVRVEGHTIHLSGIDLVDGTPILDVKPYIPEWDSVPHASSGWLKDAPFPTLKVSFAAKALKDVAAAQKRLKLKGLKATLSDILSQDLRNSRDKSQNKDGLELGFFLYDFDVHFHVVGRTATVLELQTGNVMHKKERRVPPKAVGLR